MLNYHLKVEWVNTRQHRQSTYYAPGIVASAYLCGPVSPSQQHEVDNSMTVTISIGKQVTEAQRGSVSCLRAHSW